MEEKKRFLFALWLLIAEFAICFYMKLSIIIYILGIKLLVIIYIFDMNLLIRMH